VQKLTFLWELRGIVGSVHHRILYFYVGKKFVLLTHATTKTDKVLAKQFSRVSRSKYYDTPHERT